MTKQDILEALRQSIVEGDAEQTQKACAAAIEAKLDSSEILQEGMTKAMQIVGEKWNSKEYFLPDVMVAADAMKAAIEYLKPHMAAGGGGSAGTVVIGTVKGDIHSLGKNLVALFMELAGFEVYNLGEDVSAEKYVEAVLQHKADVVGSSAFVSTVAGEIVRIEEGLKAAGVRGNIFTMVGGAVLDPQWAEKVGADAYGKDAMHAVELAKAFMAKKKARA